MGIVDRQVSQNINSSYDVWCASRVNVGPLLFIFCRTDGIDRRQTTITSYDTDDTVQFLPTHRGQRILSTAL